MTETLLPETQLSSVVWNLNRHGGACRCLLRVLENEGRPRQEDADFLHRHGARHPSWTAQPGTLDSLGLFDLARELGLAAGIDLYRDYGRVQRAHRAGHVVLVNTERNPEQLETAGPSPSHVLLLTAMDEQGFVCWCPFASGMSDLLPHATPEWWNRWLCTGIVLRKHRDQ